MWEWCQLPRSDQSLFRTALYCATAFLLTAGMAFGYQTYPFAVVVVAAGWISRSDLGGMDLVNRQRFSIKSHACAGSCRISLALGSISFLSGIQSRGCISSCDVYVVGLGVEDIVCSLSVETGNGGSRKLAPIQKKTSQRFGGFAIGTGARLRCLTRATPFDIFLCGFCRQSQGKRS